MESVVRGGKEEQRGRKMQKWRGRWRGEEEDGVGGDLALTIGVGKVEADNREEENTKKEIKIF